MVTIVPIISHWDALIFLVDRFLRDLLRQGVGAMCTRAPWNEKLEKYSQIWFECGNTCLDRQLQTLEAGQNSHLGLIKLHPTIQNRHTQIHSAPASIQFQMGPWRICSARTYYHPIQRMSHSSWRNRLGLRSLLWATRRSDFLGRSLFAGFAQARSWSNVH